MVSLMIAETTASAFVAVPQPGAAIVDRCDDATMAAQGVLFPSPDGGPLAARSLRA